MVQYKEKKTGFVNNFLAHNINISSPNANANWSRLIQYVSSKSGDLNKYQYTNAINKLINFTDSNDTPDKLLEFSKIFLSLITSAEKQDIKDDPVVFDIAKLLAEVAKLSYDARAVDISRDIIGKLVSYRKNP